MLMSRTPLAGDSPGPARALREARAFFLSVLRRCEPAGERAEHTGDQHTADVEEQQMDGGPFGLATPLQEPLRDQRPRHRAQRGLPRPELGQVTPPDRETCGE